MRTLVLGGARSGKSLFAEELVAGRSCLYIATARPWPGDTDFAERINQHVQRRPLHWATEDQRDLLDVLDALDDRDQADPRGVILVDDLGTWLTHLLDSVGAWDQPRGSISEHTNRLLDILSTCKQDIILVSPEVGMGVIPESQAGRLFRDEIGTLNQRIADICERVVLSIAGQSIIIKDTPVD